MNIRDYIAEKKENISFFLELLMLMFIGQAMAEYMALNVDKDREPWEYGNDAMRVEF